MAIEIIPWEEASFEDFLLFHHLPKTAGTAVSSALENLYGNGNYKWFHGPYGALQEIAKETQYQAVGGHFHLNHPMASEVNKRMIMFTLFREPVDRVISNYYYFKANRTHHLSELANKHSLSEIFELGLGQKMQIQNEITRMTATSRGGSTFYEALDSAKETVMNYTFFGIQEQTRVLELIIKRLFNRDDFIIPVLVARSTRPKVMDVDLDTIDLIKQHNKYDLELYEYAKAVYEDKLETEWK